MASVAARIGLRSPQRGPKETISREGSPMNPPNYEVFALRYATHRDRTARANFIAVDAHDANAS
jgi:hypothetical protein